MIYILLSILLLITGCSSAVDTNVSTAGVTSPFSYEEVVFNEIPNEYSKMFTVSESKEGYYFLKIADDREYLIVPEGEEIPAGLPDNLSVISENANNIANFSSSTMDFFLALDTLDSVAMTGTKGSEWSIPEVKEALDKDEISFVGKYSAPDYEYIADSNCDLVIENTMIFHSPETLELLEKMGIPVLVEYSSYENHPLGRMEWVKVYGLITGHFKEACELFDKEAKKVEKIEENGDFGKRVAFFYISSNGYAVVRKPGDYVTTMIEMAGGEYAFKNALNEEDNMLSTMRMQMESFFTMGYDADILIYNSTIDGGVDSIEALIDKSEVLSEFSAVKSGQVYCTESNVFQSTMSLGEMVSDFAKVIKEPDVSDSELKYLYRLE